MKKNLLLSLIGLLIVLGSRAQVTQINSNRSLEFGYPLTANKSIYISFTDSTIWATDGTLAGTIQLSTTITYVEGLGGITVFNGKALFSGTTTGTGAELYVTDGTPAGTMLVSDIYPGPNSSSPDDGVSLNGFLYFTAERPAEGRELWRTDGTPGNTTFVKDVFPGAEGSNTAGLYEMTAGPGYLLFAARTAASGIELWRSDGSNAGTVLLKDINIGADSSNPRSFYTINNIVIFAAASAAEGNEIWRTDGTAGGTTLLADINPGPGSSTSFELLPGFDYPIFTFFHTFNSRAYFVAYNGTSTGQMWSTDGNAAGTAFVKDIVPGTEISLIFLINAVNLPGKFIFPVSDQNGRSELWQSDGTAGGTVLFQSFAQSSAGSIPINFVPYTFVGGLAGQQLFQGDKFFFMAETAAAGYELWVSDGVDNTAAHTHMVTDINVGAASGLELENVSYTYTSAAIFFPANNGATGSEVWRSDGTPAGTMMVADIITGVTGSDPQMDFFITNGKVIFGANNGDHETETDLYSVDGVFSPLPVKLGDFTVAERSSDAVLNWRVHQELNTKDFTVQRSFDGAGFENIGKVEALGTATGPRNYSYIDPGVTKSGKATVYYRLLITDNDGKSNQSTIVSLRIRNNDKWNVRLLANPVADNMRLVLSGINQPVQLSVIDMNGRKMYTRTLAAVNGQIAIPSENLRPGTYMLIAESENQKKTIRFVR